MEPTSKEKANELYKIFTLETGNETFSIKCSLIAVDEILKAIDWDAYEGSIGTELNYWKEVKEEIKKL